MTLRSLKCWAGPHPGVVLSQQAGQTGEENPAVHLALLLPQQEAGAGAEGHPGQVLQDQQGQQELQSVRGPEVTGCLIQIFSSNIFIKYDHWCPPDLMTGE